jgi:hypothetical protein
MTVTLDTEKRVYKKIIAKMKFVRRTAGHGLLDLRRNEDILEEFKLGPDRKKLLAQYEQECLNYVSELEDIK